MTEMDQSDLFDPSDSEPELVKPASTGCMILVAFGIALLIFLCSCKTLEKKCAERFPPSVNSYRYLLYSDTIIPEMQLQGNIPCPEWANLLPADGKSVIIAGNKKMQLQGKKGANGKVEITAIVPQQHIPKTTEKDFRDSKQIITQPCDCDTPLWDKVYTVLISLIILLGMFLALKFYKQYRSHA